MPSSTSFKSSPRTTSPWTGSMYSFLQRASSCCLSGTLLGILPSFLSLEPQVGMAWVIWVSPSPCHQPEPCFIHLRDLVFSKIFSRFQGDPAFLFLFCFRECKHDFTLPATAGSSFCYSSLPALAGSTPAHLWGRPGPFPGQLDLPGAYMPSAERMQASVSPAAAKLPHALCIPSPPAPPSPQQGRGADCRDNRWRRRRDSS